jgi:hypothetical protein
MWTWTWTWILDLDPGPGYCGIRNLSRATNRWRDRGARLWSLQLTPCLRWRARIELTNWSFTQGRGRRQQGGQAVSQRERAQHGAAAAGDGRGQAVQLNRAHKTAEAKIKEEKAISKEAKRAMKQGNALVQAAVEHLATAERSFDTGDRFVSLGGHVIKGYPTEVQVVTYMIVETQLNATRTVQHLPATTQGGWTFSPSLPT